MFRLSCKWMAAVCSLLAAVAAEAALPQPDLIAHIYFAGAAKISAAPNVNVFTNEFCSPEALALRKQTADKLAPWLAGWLQKNLGASVPDGAARLRPLLDDLQSSEWVAEARAAAGGPPEVALAIRLDNQRTAAWEAALKPFFPAATFATTADWLIFDSGTGSPRLGPDLGREILLPHDAWLTLDVNWPHLGQWFPAIGKLGLPETRFILTAQNTNFLVSGKFFFPRPLAMDLEPWQVPADLMHQPFASLTAVRGFASWLGTQDWLQPYQVTPAPDQAFIWALPSVPFQTFLAEPVPDAAGAVDQTFRHLQPLFSPGGIFEQGLVKPSLQETNHEITLVNMPMFDPFVRAVKEPSGQFLFAGGFPNFIHSKPLPPQLYQLLATPNLVLYHWEFTAGRVPTMLQFSQLALFLTHHYELNPGSAALKWLQHVAPSFGNTTTMITRTAPDQLTFIRTAQGIFTSAELFMLANWLEAKNFPGCDLRLPPMSERLKRLQNRVSDAPVPPQTRH